jgi:hypothetical protein
VRVTQWLAGNTAQYGSNLATWAYGLRMVTSPTILTSGDVVAQPYVLRLIDYYNQTLTSDTDTYVAVKPQFTSAPCTQLASAGFAPCTNALASVSTSQTVTVVCKHGIATLDGFVLTAYPSANVSLQFTPSVVSGRTLANPDVFISVNIRTCVAGAYLDGQLCKPCAAGTFSNDSNVAACYHAPAGQFVGSTGLTSASLCPVGSFSSAPGAAACTPCTSGKNGNYVTVQGAILPQQCPPNSLSVPAVFPTSCACQSGYYGDADADGNPTCTACPKGGNCTIVGTTRTLMAPLPGFSPSLNSGNRFFISCYNGACLGQLEPLNCAEGYSGNLCDICIRNTTRAINYGRSDEHNCSLCPDVKTQMTVMILLFIAAIIVIGILINSTLQNTKSSVDQMLLKIIINNIQLNGVAAGFNFDWPEVYVCERNF